MLPPKQIKVYFLENDARVESAFVSSFQKAAIPYFSS
jgi:hypothetical protein